MVPAREFGRTQLRFLARVSIIIWSDSSQWHPRFRRDVPRQQAKVAPGHTTQEPRPGAHHCIGSASHIPAPTTQVRRLAGPWKVTSALHHVLGEAGSQCRRDGTPASGLLPLVGTLDRSAQGPSTVRSCPEWAGVAGLPAESRARVSEIGAGGSWAWRMAVSGQDHDCPVMLPGLQAWAGLTGIGHYPFPGGQ